MIRVPSLGAVSIGRHIMFRRLYFLDLDLDLDLDDLGALHRDADD